MCKVHFHWWRLIDKQQPFKSQALKKKCKRRIVLVVVSFSQISTSSTCSYSISADYKQVYVVSWAFPLCSTGRMQSQAPLQADMSLLILWVSQIPRPLSYYVTTFSSHITNNLPLNRSSSTSSADSTFSEKNYLNPQPFLFLNQWRQPVPRMIQLPSSCW